MTNGIGDLLSIAWTFGLLSLFAIGARRRRSRKFTASRSISITG